MPRFMLFLFQHLTNDSCMFSGDWCSWVPGRPLMFCEQVLVAVNGRGVDSGYLELRRVDWLVNACRLFGRWSLDIIVGGGVVVICHGPFDRSCCVRGLPCERVDLGFEFGSPGLSTETCYFIVSIRVDVG